MVKAILLTLALVLFIPRFSLAQERFSSNVWAFSIQKPKGWQPISQADRDQNIGKMEFSEDTQKTILDHDKGFSFLTGYRKFDPETHEGLIPGIQIAVRKKGPSTFAVFKEQIRRSTSDFQAALDNFKIIEEVDVEISGIKAVKTIFTFTVKMADGQVLKARTRVYSIPRNSYFFQVNFNDGTETATDCSAEFDSLVKSISITR